jgi:hypothetical protein
VILDEPSAAALRAMFSDELEATLAGQDVHAHNGFGPNTDRALLELALGRNASAETHPLASLAGTRAETHLLASLAGELADLVAAARNSFAAELAAHYPDESASDYGAAVQATLARMADRSAREWIAERADPADRDAAREHGEARRATLTRLLELDPDDPAAAAEIVASCHDPADELPPADSDLDFDASAALFEQRIAPEILSAPASDSPTAVLVCAAGDAVLAARRRLVADEHVWSDCAIVDSGLLAAYHPHSRPTVPPPARDLLLWAAMAIAHMVETRGDVVVATPGGLPALADLSDVFAEAGFRVLVLGDPIDSAPGRRRQATLPLSGGSLDE